MATTLITRIAILWLNAPRSGRIIARRAGLRSLRVAGRRGRARGDGFNIASRGPCRLELEFDSHPLLPGPQSPIVTVAVSTGTFSFFLRDVSAEWPILLPDSGVAVTDAADKRSYDEILADVRGRGLTTRLDALERQPEESFQNAAAYTRDLKCPIWLGLGRDVRIFELAFEYEGQWDDYVIPKFHNVPVRLPELGNEPVRYNFMVGRGVGVTRRVTRRLDQGCLPILHAEVIDEDITYDCTAFVSMERGRLARQTVRGTDFLAADMFSWGAKQTTPEAGRAALAEREIDHSCEPTLYFRAVAANTAGVPRYAWFKSVVAGTAATWTAAPKSMDGRFAAGRVFAVSKVNARPMPQEEMAVLIPPAGRCVFEFYLPHSPVPPERARALVRQDFDRRLAECRRFWRTKLAKAAKVSVPETRIDEMIRAGLLHLDLITFGREPRRPLAASVGRYAPIGSESSPIIQFHDSMGLHRAARRAIEYFFAKQRDDGFIQNYENYMLETGPVLWTAGEHYRYTRDDAWARRVAPKIIKACDYLMAWSGRNRKAGLRRRGYGLLEGKVGDPEDNFRIFMLNAYACLGLNRAQEMLQRVDRRSARRIRAGAESLTHLVRTAFFQALARSPVVPLGDGTWCPSAPSWAEGTGPACLYADKVNAYTHATFVARDSLLGPLYLLFAGVLRPDEPAADWLVKYHTELMYQRNAAFSQPYYSVHPWVHLARGEVAAFLKTYYNTVAALADRETYTFWEHLFQASPHKTHEEAQFLMQTRSMLWMESGDTLRLLPGVPRAWLDDGKEIRLDGVATYFGPLTLHVESRLKDGHIRAAVECRGARRPKAVQVRLPHPEGSAAVRASSGTYDPRTETVTLRPFSGHAEVTLHF